jgi:hypothetical protein
LVGTSGAIDIANMIVIIVIIAFNLRREWERERESIHWSSSLFKRPTYKKRQSARLSRSTGSAAL